MGWKDVHANLSRLARAKGALDAEEATWLLRAKRERVHEHLGYGSVVEYLERIFGYRPRLAYEKIRVAEALEDLPEMRARLAAAELSWSAVRELTRVVIPETEAVWIAEALGKSVRETERLVAGRRPGDLPSDPPVPGAMRCTLRLDITGDTMAAFRDVRDAIVRDVGHHLDDDELLAAILERALASGARDEGLSAYQVKMTVCKECGRGERIGGGESFPVSAAHVEQALCDAQILGADPKDPLGATQNVPRKVRRHILRRDDGCLVPGCRNSAFHQLHHLRPRAEGGSHDPENLVRACSAHHAAIHRGAIRIEVTGPESFAVYHADGRPYGTQPLAPAPTWAQSDENQAPASAPDRPRDDAASPATPPLVSAAEPLDSVPTWAPERETGAETPGEEATGTAPLPENSRPPGELAYDASPSASTSTWADLRELRLEPFQADGSQPGLSGQDIRDVITGLHRLGFPQKEAEAAVSRAAARSGVDSVNALLRASLRELVPPSGGSHCAEPLAPYGA